MVAQNRAYNSSSFLARLRSSWFNAKTNTDAAISLYMPPCMKIKTEMTNKKSTQELCEGFIVLNFIGKYINTKNPNKPRAKKSFNPRVKLPMFSVKKFNIKRYIAILINLCICRHPYILLAESLYRFVKISFDFEVFIHMIQAKARHN
jgi:hypothetical protein